MKFGKWMIVLLSLMLFAGCSPALKVSPQMQECLKAHGSRQEYLPVVSKYADDAMVQEALNLLIVPEPVVVQVDVQGPRTVYTVEGYTFTAVDEINPGDIVTYRAAWEGNRIVAVEILASRDFASGYRTDFP